RELLHYNTQLDNEPLNDLAAEFITLNIDPRSDFIKKVISICLNQYNEDLVNSPKTEQLSKKMNIDFENLKSNFFYVKDLFLKGKLKNVGDITTDLKAKVLKLSTELSLLKEAEAIMTYTE